MRKRVCEKVRNASCFARGETRQEDWGLLGETCLSKKLKRADWPKEKLNFALGHLEEACRSNESNDEANDRGTTLLAARLTLLRGCGSCLSQSSTCSYRRGCCAVVIPGNGSAILMEDTALERLGC